MSAFGSSGSGAVQSYAGRLQSGGHPGSGPRAWLCDAGWLGGLAAAAGAAWRGLATAHPALRLVVAGYLAVEGLFYLWSKYRVHHLNRLLLEDCPDTSRQQLLFERFLELSAVFCIKDFLSGWFMGCPPEAVLRGNVEEFVAVEFHCKLMHQLSEAEQATIRRFVDEVEERWGMRFDPGFDPELPFMCHLWEPLRAYHKPLAVYAATEGLARVAHLLMWLMGFRRRTQGRFTYWLAIPHGEAAGYSAAAAGGEFLSPPTSPLAAPHMRRHSTSDAVVEAVHQAADAVHHVAEHALDATLTVTSAAAAVVAAQHPHGAPIPLSPRALSPLPSRALSRALSPVPPSARANGHAPAAEAGVVTEAASGGSSGGEMGVPAVRAVVEGAQRDGVIRRRGKGDSASDYPSSGLAAAAAAGAAGAAAGAAGAAAAAGPGSQSSVPLSPFQLAAPPPPLAMPLPSATSPAAAAGAAAAAAAGGTSSSPADSAGSGLGSRHSTRPDVPIVFVHGVGFGVLPYLHLIREIMYACSSTPVFMVEVPHVALRLCWEAEQVDDVANAVAAMLRRHGYRRACIVGHSYGTFVCSRLCQLHPKLVHSCCLLDPVAMLLCYPQLLFNFIYKEPSAANFTSLGGAIDLLRFLCSRDLTIAQTICRKFQWSELQLWPQDLPRRSLVVLSGQDDLVPSELVMAHIKLTGHPAKVMHHPDLGHGGILMSPSWQQEFVGNLRSMLIR